MRQTSMVITIWGGIRAAKSANFLTMIHVKRLYDAVSGDQCHIPVIAFVENS
jgi:hypothetical protein